MKHNGKLYCNLCGREIGSLNDLERNDSVLLEKEWGYFSKKDGEHHRIHICESCYDQWIQTFKIPVQIKDQTELV
ncbi:MAG: hypothetical protein KH355_03945 [Clostridiales bacterium]|nr:hypothetical protein [Clostridiales bacterium]